jgi:hypothetical protein
MSGDSGLNVFIEKCESREWATIESLLQEGHCLFPLSIEDYELQKRVESRRIEGAIKLSKRTPKEIEKAKKLGIKLRAFIDQ